jgi:hypothetical protein
LLFFVKAIHQDVLAIASADAARSFSAIQRPSTSLDYWDGEP